MSVVATAQSLGYSKKYSQALAKAVSDRVTLVHSELLDLSAAFEFKTVQPAHVRYAWKKAVSSSSPSSCKHVQSGGNPDVTLPSEYFGDASHSYYPLTEVAPFEVNIDPSILDVRGEIPYKELMGGGSSGDVKFFNEAAVADWLSGHKSSLKLNKASLSAMSQTMNSFSSLLLKKANLAKAKTPAALLKLARGLYTR